MAPFAELRKEVISSKEFAYAVITYGNMRKLSLPEQAEIIMHVANYEDHEIIGTPMFSCHLSEIIEQDRKIGFGLFFSILKKHSFTHFDNFYISDSISPLQDNEVTELFKVLEGMGNIIDIVVILPGFCKSNLLPLVKCVRGWLSKPDLKWAIHQFCLNILPVMYNQGASATAAKEGLKQMLVDDLTLQGIKVKSIKDATYGKDGARDFSDYIRYLLGLDIAKDYDKEIINKTLSKYNILSSFLPELCGMLKDGPIEHPLLFYLHDEREVELCDLESNIRSLQVSRKTSEVRKRLLKARNDHELHDTISEMTVLRELSWVGRYEPYPYKGIIDGRLVSGECTVNIEVIHPTSGDMLDYAGGGWIHSQHRAQKIVPKLQKIKKIGEQRTPFLIVVNATRTPFIAEHIRNYLFGNLKFGYKISGKTQELIDSFMFRDSTERGAGLTDEDRKLLSGVLCYRRTVLPLGLQYVGEFIRNNSCSNPISEDLEGLIINQFNKFIRYQS
jgi:hypothetical protein